MTIPYAADTVCRYVIGETRRCDTLTFLFAICYFDVKRHPRTLDKFVVVDLFYKVYLPPCAANLLEISDIDK